MEVFDKAGLSLPRIKEQKSPAVSDCAAWMVMLIDLWERPGRQMMSSAQRQWAHFHQLATLHHQLHIPLLIERESGHDSKSASSPASHPLDK